MLPKTLLLSKIAQCNVTNAKLLYKNIAKQMYYSTMLLKKIVAKKKFLQYGWK